MSDCLHCDINELINEYLKNAQEPVDLAELASMIAQSLGGQNGSTDLRFEPGGVVCVIRCNAAQK